MSRQNWFRRTGPDDTWEPLQTFLPPVSGPDPDPGDPDDENPDADPAETITHGVDLTVNDVGLRYPSNLTTVSGPVSSTRDGQVIERLLVTVSGQGNTAITVTHSNVTVRDCFVRHRNQANGVEFVSGASGTVEWNNIEDDTATGWLADNGSIAVFTAGNTTVYRNYCAGYRVGGYYINNNIIVRENFYARNFNGQFTSRKGSGCGSYRGGSTGNIRFERNNIFVTASNSAGINLYAVNPIRDVNITDNHFNSIGGGFGLRGGDTSHGAKEFNRDIRITGNRFSGTFQWPNVLGEGTNAGVNESRPGAEWTNNRWIEGWGDHTVDLPARCGIRQNACEP